MEVPPNDEAKLPEPPAKAFKLLKPGWDPGQSSAVGLACPPQSGLPVKRLMVPLGGGPVVTITSGWAR
jgi:hypothetical protein